MGTSGHGVTGHDKIDILSAHQAIGGMDLPTIIGREKDVNIPHDIHSSSFWDMTKAAQRLTILAVSILTAGIFVSLLSYCMEMKGLKTRGPGLKFVESSVDLDDQTDSEVELINADQ